MQVAARALLCLVALALPAAAAASTLSLTVDHHMVVTAKEGQRGRKILRAVWSEENVLANLSIDVYQLPQLPSTHENYRELQTLAVSPRWVDELQWSLARADNDQPIALSKPRLVTREERSRGPNAKSANDRDTRVPVTSLRARFDFGLVPPGDYKLSVTAGGLKSSFEFSVRVGADPDVRDAFLQSKARFTTDFSTFRRLELERFERDPARIDALLDLIDRSVQEGGLDETREYFDLAIGAYRARRSSLSGQTLSKVDDYVRALAAARESLPEYFSRRNEWSMTRDPHTSVYSIRSRKTNEIVRVLVGPEKK